MKRELLAFLLVGLGSGCLCLEKCPIFQTTNPSSPCYLAVSATEDGGPVPPFVYAFALPHPSARQPCPVLQSVEPGMRCYVRPSAGQRGEEPPAFRLVLPLPKGADTVDESLYVTKKPSQLSFPNPVIKLLGKYNQN